MDNITITITEQDFKGHKILVFSIINPITNKSRILFSSGIKKLELILNNIKSIQDFVTNNTIVTDININK